MAKKDLNFRYEDRFCVIAETKDGSFSWSYPNVYKTEQEAEAFAASTRVYLSKTKDEEYDVIVHKIQVIC